MKESIGGISLMSIFIFFFIMVTFFLTGAIIYYKGFKINSQIINSLEKYEGYNALSAEEIDRTLGNLSYRSSTYDGVCGTAEDGSIIPCLASNGRYDIDLSCETVYSYVENSNNSDANVFKQNKFIVYKVKSYIYIDLPLNIHLKIPITTKSKRIYQFPGYENGLGC